MPAPLDADLSTVDTSLPLLKDMEYYDVKIDKAEITKTAAGADMLHLDFVTINGAKSLKNEDLGPGVHVFDNMMLAPVGKSTWQMVIRNVASLVQAVQLQGLGNYGANAQAQCSACAQWAPQLVGRTLRIKVGYEPEGVSKTGKAFRAKNVILLYLKQQ